VTLVQRTKHAKGDTADKWEPLPETDDWVTAEFGDPIMTLEHPLEPMRPFTIQMGQTVAWVQFANLVIDGFWAMMVTNALKTKDERMVFSKDMAAKVQQGWMWEIDNEYKMDGPVALFRYAMGKIFGEQRWDADEHRVIYEGKKQTALKKVQALDMYDVRDMAAAEQKALGNRLLMLIMMPLFITVPMCLETESIPQAIGIILVALEGLIYPAKLLSLLRWAFDDTGRLLWETRGSIQEFQLLGETLMAIVVVALVLHEVEKKEKTLPQERVVELEEEDGQMLPKETEKERAVRKRREWYKKHGEAFRKGQEAAGLAQQIKASLTQTSSAIKTVAEKAINSIGRVSDKLAARMAEGGNMEAVSALASKAFNPDVLNVKNVDIMLGLAQKVNASGVPDMLTWAEKDAEKGTSMLEVASRLEPNIATEAKVQALADKIRPILLGADGKLVPELARLTEDFRSHLEMSESVKEQAAELKSALLQASGDDKVQGLMDAMLNIITVSNTHRQEEWEKAISAK